MPQGIRFASVSYDCMKRAEKIDKKAIKQIEQEPQFMWRTIDELFCAKSTECLKGIGPKLADKLAAFGIHSVENLAFTRAAFPLEPGFTKKEVAVLVSMKQALMQCVPLFVQPC